MFRLPVSGLEVVLQQPTGAEDLLLLEALPGSTDLALALIARVAQPSGGAVLNWDALTITDLETMLLLLRRMVFGDLVRADFICPTDGCRAHIDVAFRIGDYLAHHKPHPPRGLEPADEAGWFRFREEPVKFRLPNAADQMAIAHEPQPDRELIRRCIQPAKIPARLRQRVEGAMESLAPNLSHALQGKCPECQTAVGVYFDVQQFILQELRDQAAFVYGDIHLLALHYHWSEERILTLPRNRRVYYAEMLRQGGPA